MTMETTRSIHFIWKYPINIPFIWVIYIILYPLIVENVQIENNSNVTVFDGLPSATVAASRQKRLQENDGALFVLPSQLNGAEYPSHLHEDIVYDVEDIGKYSDLAEGADFCQ